MAEQIQAPKGIPEYVPPEGDVFRHVRETLTKPAILAGYKYIELPYFEDAALFSRGIGESTDVVSKEMYTFTDRGDRALALRPEGTAGVIRSVIENSLTQQGLPVKLWYAGAFFRAEKPQKGRYRQLQQVGVEAVGSDSPALDAEIIAIGYQAFKDLGLKNFELQLTSLGCKNCRPGYREKLQNFLAKLNLDEDTKLRAELNPLRVLDDKRSEIQKLLLHAPLMLDHLCEDCSNYHEVVLELLAVQQIPYVVNKRLVRGLDYYTRTTFEFVHHGLGAQSGIGGGGRYDQLMQSLGGQDLSGIGFGLGVDRAYLAAQTEGIKLNEKLTRPIAVIAISNELVKDAFLVSAQLRQAGFIVDQISHTKNLKSGLKVADRLRATAAVIIGPDEVAVGLFGVKLLDSGVQVSASLSDLASVITQHLTLDPKLPKED
jgi:histidyl-tRNA synthetase